MHRFAALLIFALAHTTIYADSRLFYAGDGGSERFNDVHRLSDGTLLVAGQASSLDWIPGSVPRTMLAPAGIASNSPGNTGFILHLTADLGSILDVAAFPTGSVRDVRKIRSTEIPGQPSGAIYISGTRDGTSAGYYIARLNANWLTTRPTALSWAHNADCAAGSDYQKLQPWDVGSDGEVVFGRGKEFDANWAVIERLDANGQRRPVEHWHAHWFDDPGVTGDQEWDGTPASSYAGSFPLLYSALVLKAQRRGSLRSSTQVDFDLLQPDGNGNPGRKGRYPDDYYFSGPCGLASGASCPGGPGYTGYRINSPTQRLGGVAVDRRNGNFYFGYSTQTLLPGGQPDFEPAIVAMEADGSLLWWNRLYRETTSNSTPDQHVDGIAIDYARNELVVLARTHGSNTYNFWQGDQIAANPLAHGFQNRFSGTNGNIHVSWLGKFSLTLNELHASTYVGEYVEGSTNYGAPFATGLLTGWPNPNGGWPNLNTTRNCNDLKVASDGAVGVICQGRRTMTTNNAWQTMPYPIGADASLMGTWNYFARVYEPDLSNLRYSTLITGAWNTTNGQGGDNTSLFGLEFAPDALLVAGVHNACTSIDSVCDAAMVAGGVARPNALTTSNPPTWGQSLPESQSAILGRLQADSLMTDTLFANGFE